MPERLTPADFSGSFDLAVVDVSFISVTKILPALVALLAPKGQIVVLIKPQFEVGKGEVGKGGIVREAGEARTGRSRGECNLRCPLASEL